MKKDLEKKEYSEKEVAQQLIKSIYKGILKNMKNRPYKDEASKVVRDILDPNSVAEIDPDEIPSKKTNIMNKSKKKGVEKLKDFQKKQGVPKGADPATHERCIQDVKGQGKDKSSAYAICNAAGAGKKKKKD